MDKLDLDRAITRFLHSLSQVIAYSQIALVLLHFQCFDKFYFSQPVVLGSSLADRSREMRDEVMTQ